MIRRFVAICTIQAFLPGAYAQEPVRLEFRIVPQLGEPTTPVGAGIVDLPLTSPAAPLTLAPIATPQRFTLQFRLLDLDPTEPNFVPVGLAAAAINITLDNPAAGTLDRAQLSRFQAQIGAGIPPSPDLSGLPTGTAVARRGMHVPYRGGFSDSNNNNLASNGTISPIGITNIYPLSSGQNPQFPFDNTAWYGLYTFNYIPNPAFAGLVNITAEAIADPGTGNRFAWLTSGNGVPIQSRNATTGVAYIALIPTPTTAILLMLAALPTLRRPREARRASQ